MKNQNLFFSLIFIFALTVSNITYSQETNNFSKLELSDRVVNIDSKLEYNPGFNKIGRIRIQGDNPDKKSPYLAALFSGLVPGTGEFYAQSYIKSAIFFAAEVGLSGEIRAVNRVEQRILEAEKLGFEKIILSKFNKIANKRFNIEIIKVSKIEEVIQVLF